MDKIALIPGGFKPPTLGHFHVVNEISKHNEINKIIVIIGQGVRNNINAEQSLSIWNIYKKYLPKNIEVIISPKSSPILYILDTVLNNPQNFYFPVVGYRDETDEKDLNRFNYLEKKEAKNYKTIIIKGNKDISGTKAREALLQNNKELFLNYIPSELSKDDKNKVWNILHPSPINEGQTTGRQLLLDQIKSLTEYMINKGMEIQPLPKLKIIDNDKENAKDFFGKTAYYDPNQKLIVLYTKGRHDKDCCRSYAHEMIHHAQNLKGELNNILTTNTTEDSNLDKIEREAYLEGNITFRNWTDNTKKSFMEDLHESLTKPFLNEGKYDSIVSTISKDIFQTWKEDYTNGENESELIEEYDFNGFKIEINAYIKYIRGIDKFTADGGANSKHNYVEINFEIDPSYLPEFWSEISMNLKDVLRHEIEHLTHGEGPNLKPSKYLEPDSVERDLINAELLKKYRYYILPKEVDANLQGLYLKAKKERKPFINVVNRFLDAQNISSEEKTKIIDIWNERTKHLSLPRLK